MGGDRGDGDAGEHVVVDGWGPVAAEVTTQLRRCGVVVRSGGHAADGAELALSLGSRPPRAVVLVDSGRGPAWASAPWQARRVPHLPLLVRADRVVVGPLVLPGRTACVRCADAAWEDVGPRAPEHLAAESVVLAAAVATVTVLAVLRGDATLGGISTEIDLSSPAVSHRLWNPAPGCRCGGGRMVG